MTNAVKIVVAHLTKGGSGKTTLACNIAVEVQRRGYSVALVDYDEDQQASIEFTTRRLEYGGLKEIDGYLTPTDKELTEILSKYDIVVMDTGGYDLPSTQALIALGDHVLIPSNINKHEIKALESFAIKMINISKITKRDLTPVIVPSRLNSKVTKTEAKEHFAPLLRHGYSIADPIYYRIAYQRCLDIGKGITEYKDKKAELEIYNLINTLQNKGITA